MDGVDQCQHLRVGKPLVVRAVTTLSSPVRVAFLIDKSILHSDSLAKYTAAFFKISRSCLNTTSAERSRVLYACYSLPQRLGVGATDLPGPR